MITFFILRRPIIAGWGRDMGTILRPIWISIRICGWRLDRSMDSIKIRCMGSPTLRPRTCERPVVSQTVSSTQSKEFVALQKYTAQLTQKYDHLSTGYTQLSVNYEQLRQMVMNMASHSGDTCAPPFFWSFNNQPPPPPPPPPAPPLC
jgi:hypothetical protein